MSKIPILPAKVGIVNIDCFALHVSDTMHTANTLEGGGDEPTAQDEIIIYALWLSTDLFVCECLCTHRVWRIPCTLAVMGGKFSRWFTEEK